MFSKTKKPPGSGRLLLRSNFQRRRDIGFGEFYWHDIPTMTPPKRIITREIFLRATGREPVLDDLERCNCSAAGEVGHFTCGWNEEQQRPQWEVGLVGTIRY